MAGRKVKRKHKGKYVILISTIAILNLLGLSYANWNDHMEIANSFSTGKIDPLFCKNELSIDKIRGNGDLTVSFDGKNTIIINGEVDSDYKAFLNYCVVNKGTVPVKFTGQHQKIDDGLKLQFNQQSGIINPQDYIYSEDGNGNPKLQIQAEKEGTYNFEVELPFQQWNYE